MDRRNHYPLSPIATLRRLAMRLGCIGLPLLAAGCAEQGPLSLGLVPQHPTVARGAAPESLPPAKPDRAAVVAVAHSAEAHAPKFMPIALDTVLHLAAEQNLLVGQARAKVDEADAKVDLAHKKCFPFKKHPSNVTMAEEDYWKQKADLSKLTADTMLDASTAYIDLLAARTGRTIAESLLADLQDLETRANNLAKVVPASRVEAARIRAEIAAFQANISHFDTQVAAASAKLVYLLALDPCTALLPVDMRLLPIDLIDATMPACDLVAKALAQGPGIRELEGLVGVTDEAMAHCQIFWVLIYCKVAHEAKRIAEAQQAEAHLAYEDLRGKLTAGVQESRETILNGIDEMRRGGQQFNHSGEARQLSKERLDNNVMGSSPSEVLLSLQALGSAQLNYLNAIRDYDKAQLRLLILTNGPSGPGGPCAANGGPAHQPPHGPMPGPALPGEQLPSPRQQAQ